MEIQGKFRTNPFKSVSFKTVLLTLLLLTALAALGTKTIIDFQRRQLLTLADREAGLLAGFIEDGISDAMVRGEAEKVQPILEKAGKRDSLSGAWLTDKGGVILASSNPAEIGGKAYNVQAGSARFSDNNGLVFSKTVSIIKKQECIGCHDGNSPVLGFLTVGITYGRVLHDLELLMKWLLGGLGALGIILAVSLVAFLSRTAVRPVRLLSAAIEAAGRELDLKMGERHGGEIKCIYEGFHSLMSRIKDARENAERAHLEELKKYSMEIEKINCSLDEKVNKLSALSGIGRSMNATRKFDDLLRMIITSAARELKADRGSLMLMEKGVGELFVHTGKAPGPELPMKTRFKVGEGVAGWVAKHREPAIIPDTLADPRFLLNGGPRVPKSLLSVPLAGTSGEVLGVINLERGTAKDPFGQGELDYLQAIAGQASIAIENVELIQDLHKSYFDTILALAHAVEAKDRYTVGHCDRVTQYSIALGEEFGLSDEEIATLQYGATLHDLGKIGISEALLNKPDRLTDEEYRIMKEHAAIGENIVRGVDFLRDVRPIIRHHQERYDGKGYPDGLRGDEIPLPVAIVTLADSFDALTTDRPYRKAKSVGEALDIIKNESGKKYNPVVVERFLKIFGEGMLCKGTA